MPTAATHGCAITMQAMHLARDATKYPAASKTWHWALDAGAFPPLPDPEECATTDVLLTGHDDGSVSFWDVSAEVPRRVALAEAHGRQRKVVSAIAVDAAAGLLATGHFGGEVRIYAFWPEGTSACMDHQ